MRIKNGDRVRDIVSGFGGIVIACTDWLYGCRRLTVQPEKVGDNGKPVDPQSFDEPQLELLDSRVVPEQTPAQASTGGPRPEPVRREVGRG